MLWCYLLADQQITKMCWSMPVCVGNQTGTLVGVCIMQIRQFEDQVSYKGCNEMESGWMESRWNLDGNFHTLDGMILPLRVANALVHSNLARP